MSEPYLSEIKIYGFNFPPRGWAQCDGQILPINQNQSLYSLLGTTYGGDGRTTFALPDLRGRAALGFGQGGGLSSYNLGSKAGQHEHTLTVDEIPPHTHQVQGADGAQNNSSPGGSRFAATSGGRRPLTPYEDLSAPTPLNAAAVMQTGGGQGHQNMQPYLALNFCIALQGLFPSRN